jgi:hydroxylamine reductase
MFCFQCEQTSKGTGCTDFAVCGKDESTAILQDLLVHAAKGIAQFSHRARLRSVTDAELDQFLLEALFVTMTNVNFDDAAIEKTIRRAIVLRERAKTLYQNAARKAGKRLKKFAARPHGRPRAQRKPGEGFGGTAQRLTEQ